MSQDNVDIVRGWFERWNRGERGWEHEMHPDVEIFSRLQAEPYRGIDGFRRWTQEIDDQFQTWQLVVADWHDAGERVVAVGHVHMTGHGSGVEFDQPLAWVVDIEGTRLRRLWFFLDAGGTLEAAGLAAESERYG